LKTIVEMSLPTQIFVLFICLISLLGIGFMQLRAKYNEIAQRKKITALMLGVFWIICVAMLTSYTSTHLATASVFFAFFIAEWLYRNDRQWLSEVIFYGFLVAAFTAQYL
jgi:hypothetical protein